MKRQVRVYEMGLSAVVGEIGDLSTVIDPRAPNFDPSQLQKVLRTVREPIGVSLFTLPNLICE